MASERAIKVTGILGMSKDGATNEIIFTCPKCGPPYEVLVRAVFQKPAIPPAVWSWDADEQYRVTVTPSISNAQHGRKKMCGWHGHIVNGEVITN